MPQTLPQALPQALAQALAQARALALELRLTLLGLLMALAGVCSFALQARPRAPPYWVLHSAWHLLVQLSVAPLLLGRARAVAVLARWLGLRGVV